MKPGFYLLQVACATFASVDIGVAYGAVNGWIAGTIFAFVIWTIEGVLDATKR